jgi:hypothetical protein
VGRGRHSTARATSRSTPCPGHGGKTATFAVAPNRRQRGIFSTLSAYIVNPPRDGELVGRPSVGFAYVNLGHDMNLEALTITESPFKRLELGYGWDNLSLGDLPLALRNAGLVNYHEDQVQLHNFNARLQLLKEGEFDQNWIPAVTAGVHYK